MKKAFFPRAGFLAAAISLLAGLPACSENQVSGPPDAEHDGDPAAILSAYLGLLDANAFVAAALGRVSGCRQTAGDDAMPVVFSVQLDEDSIPPTDFEVTNRDGQFFTPSCATLRPALGEDERRTVLLTGPMGSAGDPPETVDVVGELTVMDVAAARRGTIAGQLSPPVRQFLAALA